MRRHVLRIFLGVLVAAGAWWFGDIVSAAARTGWRHGGATAAITAVSARLRHFPWPVSSETVDVAVGVAVVVLFALLVVFRVAGRGARRLGEEHGSARWGRHSDIAPLMHHSLRRNLLLTRTERIGLDRPRSVQHQRNLNVACIGASGSGKSRFFIQPNLAQAQTSCLVTDTKGELLAGCGQHLDDAGHTIRVLDLVNLDRSDSFNPFAYLRPGHEPEDVTLMAINIIANTSDGGASSSDPFWPRAERALFSALFGFVAATYPPKDQNLGSVVDLLGQMRASSDEKTLSAADAVFTAGQDYLDANPAMARADLLQYALAMYQIYQQAAEKTAASIIVTGATRLAPLHIPAVRRIVSRDTLDLDMVGFEPTAIFLILSDTNKQWAWLSAMVLTTFFQRAIYLADRQLTRRLPVPVMCWMDEFANIGRIPDFEQIAATVRSRGISYQMGIQTVGQGKALYRDGWSAILGNCDTVLFLGSADPDTRDYISKALGKQTITVTDESQSKGSHGSYSRADRRQGRELLTPDEVGRLPGREALVLIRGLPPFRSKKLAPITTGNYRHHAARHHPQDTLSTAWDDTTTPATQ